eukprot:TRINITY_DN10486_c0_g1_i1.p1 TRINITY_DN10486_c0_g1~~TRINITY_DN10486_c0_g1_i1.p1  ORF type:complete len:177 (+),score=19.19 TRINITY_DN10486_c0_g1_i1:27-557(+)
MRRLSRSCVPKIFAALVLLLAAHLIFTDAILGVLRDIHKCRIWCNDPPPTAPFCNTSQQLSVDMNGLSRKFQQEVAQLAELHHYQNKIIFTTVYIPDRFLRKYYFKFQLYLFNWALHINQAMPDYTPIIVCVDDHTCNELQPFQDRARFVLYRDSAITLCDHHINKYVKKMFAMPC